MHTDTGGLSTKARVILGFSGVVFALFLLEGALRLVEYIGTTTASRTEVINEFSKLHEYDEQLGWKLIPGAEGRQKNAEFDVTYHINKQGHRDVADYSPKRSEAGRIVAIGDSFTFGVGVPDEKTYIGLLRKEGYDTLNFGVSGYDPGQYLLSLREALAYHPDTIIFGIYLGNDIEDLPLDHLSQGDKFKPYFQIQGGRLALKNVPVPQEKPTSPETYTDYRVKNKAFYERFGWLLRLRTLGFLKNAVKNEFYPVLEKMGVVKSISDYDYHFELLAKILEQANEESNSKLVVLVIPSKNIKSNYIEQKFGERLETILKEKHIQFVSAINEAKENPDIYFRVEGHWNEQGHEIASHLILDKLREKSGD